MNQEDITKLDELFDKIGILISCQDEKSHNWNTRHIKSLVVNEWLIFKKNKGNKND